VRTPVKDLSWSARNTQGGRLIRLEKVIKLSGLERVAGLGAEAAEGGAGRKIRRVGRRFAGEDFRASTPTTTRRPFGRPFGWPVRRRFRATLRRS